MIKPRLVKAQDILSKVKALEQEVNDLNYKLKAAKKFTNWALEFKLEKAKENPREEFRRLFL